MEVNPFRGEGKTALVLSPGGMFGAYQAGVLQVLADRVQPDLIVGVSVGALNGWTIAGGCTPTQLQEIWRDPETASILTMRDRKSLLRGGYFDPAPLLRKAEEIHRLFQPRMPYGLVVVRVPGFHTELIPGEHVIPLHLLATCSIPLFFPTVRIGPARYTDGGTIQAMPLWAAAAMGATRIIAVNSLPRVFPLWLDLPMRSIRIVRPPKRLPPGIHVTTVTPSEKLGGAQEAVIWKRENVDRWIALGVRDAARQIPLQ